jgi:hypothetical protein
VNWQYKTIVLPSSEQRENMLTEMGLNGWELVGFEQGLAYFKRPKSKRRLRPAGSLSSLDAVLDPVTHSQPSKHAGESRECVRNSHHRLQKEVIRSLPQLNELA